MLKFKITCRCQKGIVWFKKNNIVTCNSLFSQLCCETVPNRVGLQLIYLSLKYLNHFSTVLLYSTYREREIERLRNAVLSRFHSIHIPGDETIQDRVDHQHHHDVQHGEVITGVNRLVEIVPS